MMAARHYDGTYPGLCPCCLGAPRHVSRNGLIDGYCRMCRNEKNMSRPRKYNGRDPGICPRCQTRTRSISRNNLIDAYCKDCRTRYDRERRER